ncbi:MAG: NAD(P)H-dependent glycerol-3-phosphate dehydrogenase [Erysipelotrichaceae bacterium]|nr:NAD(P)H-dependent glycerol-3-phosphate dehydrogenase [Erysipelotrichaceae bacterium]
MSRIGVFGAGTWGIALARMLRGNSNEVTVWSAHRETVDNLRETRRQKNLPNVVLPEGLIYTTDIEETCRDQEIIVIAVPSIYVRETVRKAAPYVTGKQIVVDVAKGIEAGTLMTMSEIINEEIGKVHGENYCPVVTLSGPTHAEEVAAELPSTIVAASWDAEAARRIQDVFTSEYMRVYTNDDIKGVEICGALKNVIALASGISAGLGYGDNARAALITRGMVEIVRLGDKLGCHKDTFYGLAGIGDLIVTATSHHSRNNRCGYYIGQGYSVEDAVKQVGMVVEGINTIDAAITLSRQLDVDMPIVKGVDQIVNHGADPSEIVRRLMNRDRKSELPKPLFDLNYERIEDPHPSALTKDSRIVGVYGDFDLPDFRTINFLRRSRMLGDWLIAFVCSDEYQAEGGREKCVLSAPERRELLRSIVYVDEVVSVSSPEELKEQLDSRNVSMIARRQGESEPADTGRQTVHVPAN